MVIQMIRNNRKLYRLAALLLATALILTALPTSGMAVTKEEIANLRAQAASLEKEKAALQQQINEVAASKNSALEQKQLLEQKIEVLRNQIAVSEATIADLTDQIAQKEQELADAKAEEARYFDLFCDRVRSMEEDGDISYWVILFQAESFSSLLDQLTMIGEIMDYDQEVRDQLEAARIAVDMAKQALEQSKAEEEQVRASLNNQKSELQAEEAKVDALIGQLTSQAAAYADEMDILQADADNMAKEIKQAEKTYAAQLEAQRKAEEAAREAEEARKAEEAKKAAAAKAAASVGIQNASATTPSSGTAVRTGGGGFIWPLSGYTRVSSTYGYRTHPVTHQYRFHGGIDIPAPNGTPIMAAKSGVVIISTLGGSYGNHVAIAHGDGTRTLYAHMSSRAVSAGQSVSQGQVIGYVGSTGRSTGNHLHYEIWTGSSSSSRTNPLNYY